MLTSKPFKAEKALKLGLVDGIVPPADLLTAARSLALQIAQGRAPRLYSLYRFVSPVVPFHLPLSLSTWPILSIFSLLLLSPLLVLCVVLHDAAKQIKVLLQQTALGDLLLQGCDPCLRPNQASMRKAILRVCLKEKNKREPCLRGSQGHPCYWGPGCMLREEVLFTMPPRRRSSLCFSSFPPCAFACACARRLACVSARGSVNVLIPACTVLPSAHAPTAVPADNGPYRSQARPTRLASPVVSSSRDAAE